MQNLDDSALLREYVERGSEEAFATIVSRHVDKVYSVALRHTGNPHSAEEITQAVFVILAEKANRLGKKVILSGWLYHTARLASVTFLRGEIRRTHREQEAHLQTELDQNESDNWAQIGPLLDAAMAGLNETDRHAIVLRYFDGKSMREVGTALGASEDAAKMRINRAVEKLRLFFTKRGIATSASGLTAIISTRAVQAAPMTLAKAATSIALTKSTASASTLTLIKGALKIMAWTKTKTAIVVGIGILFIGGTTTVAIHEIRTHWVEVWQREYNLSIMGWIPQQVKILPAIPSRWGENFGENDHGKMGLGVTIMDMFESAYDYTQGRIIVATPLPAGTYDFMANLPNGAAGPALQREITKQFGLVGKKQVVETNVFLLVLRNRNAPELKLTAAPNESKATRNPGDGSYWCVNHPISDLAGYLEDCLKTPVVNQTGLTNNYDIEFIGGSDPEKLKQVVLNEVGLELVPSRAPIEYLVIEKTN